MPQEAGNRHFGKLLAPLIDYFVEVGSQAGGPRPNPATWPPPASKEETSKVNVYLSECQYLHSGLKFPARMKPLAAKPWPCRRTPRPISWKSPNSWPPAP